MIGVIAAAGRYNTATVNIVFDGISQSLGSGTFFQFRDIEFSPDGTSLYGDGFNSGRFREYNLSPGYNINTAVNDTTYIFGGEDSTPNGIDMRPDGSEFFLVGTQFQNIYKYDFGTNYDIASLSFNSSGSVSGSYPFFNPSGSKLYTFGTSLVYEYDVSPAYDVTGLSLNASHSIADVGKGEFNSTGTKLYTFLSNTIKEYDLSVAYDLSTVSLLNTYDVSNLTGTKQGLTLKNDDSKLYLLADNSGGIVYQFSVSS